MRQRAVLGLIALIVVLGALQLFVFRSRSTPGQPPAGPQQPPLGGAPPAVPQPDAVPTPAPDFTLTTLDGATVSLKALLAEGPVLLCFYKTECGTSQVALPKYDLFQTHYGAAGKGFHYLAVVQNDAFNTRDFVKASKLQQPSAIDPPPYAVSRSYGIRSTPTLVLVGKDGAPLATVPGWSRSGANDIAKRISDLTGIPYQAISSAGDGLPDMRPG